MSKNKIAAEIYSEKLNFFQSFPNPFQIVAHP